MAVTGEAELRSDHAQLKRSFPKELQRHAQSNVLLVAVNAETSKNRKDACELSSGAMRGTSQGIERLICPVLRGNALLDRLDHRDAPALAGRALHALAFRTPVPESKGFAQSGHNNASHVLLKSEIAQARVRIQHLDQMPLREIHAQGHRRKRRRKKFTALLPSRVPMIVDQVG